VILAIACSILEIAAMPEDGYESFMSVARNFSLGNLITEARHPLTRDLAHLSQTNLTEAYTVLQEVDQLALEHLYTKLDLISVMGRQIQSCLEAGKRLFICGCGATGRLSISLEVLAREGLIPEYWQKQVVSFMAGGDAALIKSIEKFEDYPEYGEQQLLELGFGPEDLLVASTEGGETPWVIGATEAACDISNRSPWFLYCNPDTLLCREVERSRRVIENDRISKLNLSVGPMALSGSTRMQASTVLMLAIGWAMQHGHDPVSMKTSLDSLLTALRDWPWDHWQEFTQAEAGYYQNEGHTVYSTDTLGVTVLTDTTERSPTFSLAPYENHSCKNDPPCLCYLSLSGTKNSKQAWRKLLHRDARCLEWDDCVKKTGFNTLLGFNISQNNALSDVPREVFQLDVINDQFFFGFRNQELRVPVVKLGLLERHILLKMALNSHSTLVMGILGRYESNLMTYVRPSNFKLIDRSIRYVQALCSYRGLKAPEYGEICKAIFEGRSKLSANQAIVNVILGTLHSD